MAVEEEEEGRAGGGSVGRNQGGGGVETAVIEEAPAVAVVCLGIIRRGVGEAATIAVRWTNFRQTGGSGKSCSLAGEPFFFLAGPGPGVGGVGEGCRETPLRPDRVFFWRLSFVALLLRGSKYFNVA